MTDEMKKLTEMTGFPKEASEFLSASLDEILNDTKFAAVYRSAVKRFMDGSIDHNRMCGELSPVWEEGGVHEYTAKLLFYMSCAEILHEDYRKAGISDEIFYTSMTDLRCKAIECKNVKGVWGSFVSFWFPGFFNMSRFGLGRFQYEYSEFDADDWTAGGVTVKRGDRVINMHIPSTGQPLNDEVRLDSYRKAYEFYRGRMGADVIPFVCSSWLLYPAHREFLPSGSHILGFMDDFDIIRSFERDTFGDAWRVFGADADKAVSDLPEDTSLRRAYKKRLSEGGKTGGGYGVFLFDGERIIK